MKFKISIFTLLFFPCLLFSQLSVQFSSINQYLFTTKEALNVVVINSGTKAIQVQFSGKISKYGHGTVVQFKTEPITLNVGANLITPTNLGFSEISYLDNDIMEIEHKTGSYPSGAYTICIWSACTSPDCDGLGPSAGAFEQPVCTNIQIENPSPLLLNYPHDNSEIEETRPIYTWIPPAPVASSAALNYTMTLVEIYEGQSKSDALAMNIPLIEWTNINQPALMHPSDLPALVEGRSYAWQVQAYVGQTFFAKSEQWKFKIKKVEKEKKIVGKQFVILKKDDNDIHLAEDTLRLIYNENKKVGKINLIVADENGKEIYRFEFDTKYGENVLLVDLLDPKYSTNLQYNISVLLAGKQEYLLRFLVKK